MGWACTALCIATAVTSAGCAAQQVRVSMPGSTQVVSRWTAAFESHSSGGCSQTAIEGTHRGEMALEIHDAVATLTATEQWSRTYVSTSEDEGMNSQPSTTNGQVTVRYRGRVHTIDRGFEIVVAQTQCTATAEQRCDDAARVERLRCQWDAQPVRVLRLSTRTEWLLRCSSTQRLPIEPLGRWDRGSTAWLSPRTGLMVRSMLLGLYDVPTAPSFVRHGESADAH